MSDDLIERLRKADKAHLFQLPPFILIEAADEIERLRAALTPCAETKAADALQALDDALCNYTNWVNDFSELADPDHQRVFDALCAAYNGWHDARHSAAEATQRARAALKENT